jgi:hypothetical protein
MILKVLANAGQMNIRLDPQLLQHFLRSYSRELKDLGRVNRSCCQDDLFIGFDLIELLGIAISKPNTLCFSIIDEYFLYSTVGE